MRQTTSFNQPDPMTSTEPIRETTLSNETPSNLNPENPESVTTLNVDVETSINAEAGHATTEDKQP